MRSSSCAQALRVELGRGRGSRRACAPRPAAAPARRAAPRSDRRAARRTRPRRRSASSGAAGERVGVARRPRRSRRARCARRRSATGACARRVCSASSSAHSSAPGASLSTSPICQASRSRSRSSSPCFSRARGERLASRRARRPSARRAARRRPARSASSRARTAGARVRLCQACWPWMSTRWSAASRSCAIVARAAVDPGAALALRVDRPAQQQPAGVAGVGVEAGVVEPGGERRRRVELGADLGARRAFAHHAGVAAAAERELQRVDQDRLAGAGLAGQHREAGAELDLERVDDDEVAEREAVQHGQACSDLDVPEAQCSLRRRVA